MVRARLSLAVVVGILSAPVALATEQWPVALAHETRLPAGQAAAPRAARIVLRLDAATAVCVAAVAIAAILSAAAAGPRRSPPLR